MSVLLSVHPHHSPWRIGAAVLLVALALGVARPDLASGAHTHWLKLLVVAPLVEEFFFRGVIHAGLLQRRDCLGRPAMANALVALVFGAAHLGSAPAFHAVAVMGPALLLGVVYQRSRSVALCVGLHSLCNGLWLMRGG